MGNKDKAIVTKLFPRKLIHYCARQQTHEDIDTFDFISNHFLDGNNVCTPRYILNFSKGKLLIKLHRIMRKTLIKPLD